MGEGLILLSFDAFDIEPSDDGECSDGLTITDGDGTTLMNKTCGNVLPSEILSKSDTVYLKFSTDDYDSNQTLSNDGGNSGWSVRWSWYFG